MTSPAPPKAWETTPFWAMIGFNIVAVLTGLGVAHLAPATAGNLVQGGAYLAAGIVTAIYTHGWHGLHISAQRIAAAERRQVADHAHAVAMQAAAHAAGRQAPQPATPSPPAR